MKVRFEITPEQAAHNAHSAVTNLDLLGLQLDSVIERVAAYRDVIGQAEAGIARCLAEAAAIADARAGLARPESVSRSDARARERQLVATEIATATRQSERTVTTRINDSETLVTQFPATLTALAAGAITIQHARHLINHASSIPIEAQPAFERDLLVVAAETTPYRFEDTARRLRETTHPDSITTRTKTAVESRTVFIQPACDGMATLTAHLPAIHATAIDDLIDKIARAARIEADSRTHLQRRADAFTDLLLTPGNPAHPAAITAQVIITAPHTTITSETEHPGTLHGYGPIDPNTTRHVAATAPTYLHVTTRPKTGEPVFTRHRKPPTAINLTNHATIPTTPSNSPPNRETTSSTETSATPSGADTAANPETTPGIDTTSGAVPNDAGTDTHTTGTAVTGTGTSTGGAVEAGRDRYSAPNDLRLLLATIDETCRFPHCNRRANRCELDHTHDWAKGGTTTPNNLHHLCTKHHHLKHQTPWTVTTHPHPTPTPHLDQPPRTHPHHQPPNPPPTP